MQTQYLKPHFGQALVFIWVTWQRKLLSETCVVLQGSAWCPGAEFNSIMVVAASMSDSRKGHKKIKSGQSTCVCVWGEESMQPFRISELFITNQTETKVKELPLKVTERVSGLSVCVHMSPLAFTLQPWSIYKWYRASVCRLLLLLLWAHL